MPGFVDSGKREIPIFSGFAILYAVVNQRLVASGSKEIAMGIINLETDGFATEPVAYAWYKLAYNIRVRLTSMMSLCLS